ASSRPPELCIVEPERAAAGRLQIHLEDEHGMIVRERDRSEFRDVVGDAAHREIRTREGRLFEGTVERLRLDNEAEVPVRWASRKRARVLVGELEAPRLVRLPVPAKEHDEE